MLNAFGIWIFILYTYIFSILFIVAPIAQLVKGRISDAGGLRFESQAGRVTDKSIPSLWRDRHPAIKGLRSPEHHAGEFRPDHKTNPPSQKQQIPSGPQKDSSESKTTTPQQLLLRPEALDCRVSMPPEHQAGKFHPDHKKTPSQTTNKAEGNNNDNINDNSNDNKQRDKRRRRGPVPRRRDLRRVRRGQPGLRRQSEGER